MIPNTFNIYVMSYKRADTILTQNLLEYCTYVVREEEYEEYKKAGVENILTIPTGEVFDFMSTLYWIIENTEEEVIAVLDDDIKNFIFRGEKNKPIVLDDGTPDKESATREIERLAQLVVDLDLGIGCDQMTSAPYGYHKEFYFVAMMGNVRWINKKALKATYDPNDPASSDIDMIYQELLHNRIILQPRYFVSNAFMDVNDGEIYDRQEHLTLVESMKNKWGRYYEYDYRKNNPQLQVSR